MGDCRLPHIGVTHDRASSRPCPTPHEIKPYHPSADVYHCILRAASRVGRHSPAPQPVVQAVDNIGQAAGELILASLVLAGLVDIHVSASIARQGSDSPRRQLAILAPRFERNGLLPPAWRTWKQALVPAFFCLSAISWGIGQLVFTYFQQVLDQSALISSWADIGFLGVYPFLLAGIILLSSQRLTVVSRGRIILDGLMVMTALITFSWYFLLGPTLLQAHTSVFAKMVGTAYPAGDLVLIACLLMLATRWQDPYIRWAGLLLAAALAAIIVTDCCYLYDYCTTNASPAPSWTSAGPWATC